MLVTWCFFAVQRHQRKHLLAAHKEIYGHGEQVIDSQPRRLPKSKPLEKVFTPTSPTRSRSPATAIGDTTTTTQQQQEEEQKPASPKAPRTPSPAEQKEAPKSPIVETPVVNEESQKPASPVAGDETAQEEQQQD